MTENIFPVGTRVRSLPQAARDYGRRFNPAIEGTVIGYQTGSVHVDWEGGFVGHNEREGDHTGHCYYMNPSQIEVITIPIPPPHPSYDHSQFVEGFPPGTIVENIDGRALDTYSPPLRDGTHRGEVIPNTERYDWDGQLCVHVRFPNTFEGHHEGGIMHPGHCYYFKPSELRVISMPVATETVAPVIPRLRVTIARDVHNYNQWTARIENGPMPTKYEMQEYIEPAISRRLGRRIWTGELNFIIHRGIETYGVDPQVFIDAITAASLAKQAREQTGTFSRQVIDSELQMALNTQPAMIAIGDQLFTLQPKGAIKATRALQVMRERISKAARIQADKIKIAAQAEATGIVANAERQLRETRATIEKEMRAAKNVMTLPTWISENYLKVRRWDSGRYKMAVGIELSTRIVSFQSLLTRTSYEEGDASHRYPIYNQFTVKWSNNIIHPEVIPVLSIYHTVTIWMPFDHVTGDYAYKSAKIIEPNPYYLPHLSAGRCCMELQGLPAKLTGINEYNEIKKVLSRGNQEVNMMSLLTGFNSWHPDIQVQCPKQLKKLIDRSLANNLYDTEDSLLSDAIITPVEVEAKETFSVDRLRESRQARGESLPEIEITNEGVAEVGTEVEEEDNHVATE